MFKVNRNKHTWEECNKTILEVLDKIAEEKQAKSQDETNLFIVCRKLSQTVRVALQPGSAQDDHNMLYYFRLGNDLDGRVVDFNFYTADIVSIIQLTGGCFILLSY